MGKRKKEELPDYTVADMDLEGMPWNTRKSWHVPMSFPKKKKNIYGEGAAKEAEQKDQKAAQWPDTEDPLTAQERRYMAWQGLKAGLLIGLVFVGAAFLFLLFCLYVWF